MPQLRPSPRWTSCSRPGSSEGPLRACTRLSARPRPRTQVRSREPPPPSSQRPEVQHHDVPASAFSAVPRELPGLLLPALGACAGRPPGRDRCRGRAGLGGLPGQREALAVQGGRQAGREAPLGHVAEAHPARARSQICHELLPRPLLLTAALARAVDVRHGHELVEGRALPLRPAPAGLGSRSAAFGLQCPASALPLRGAPANLVTEALQRSSWQQALEVDFAQSEIARQRQVAQPFESPARLLRLHQSVELQHTPPHTLGQRFEAAVVVLQGPGVHGKQEHGLAVAALVEHIRVGASRSCRPSGRARAFRLRRRLGLRLLLPWLEGGEVLGLRAGVPGEVGRHGVVSRARLGRLEAAGGACREALVPDFSPAVQSFRTLVQHSQSLGELVAC
mmetsp:Transcript_22619/g.63526  ORF Transcript_22619/g.63526 Transcript_22619/m.63526 type:complete len:394 (+) Transcript_22619:454-1635(+)